MEPEQQNGKTVAEALVSRLQPGTEDVVEDGYDTLAANKFQVPEGVSEHAFQIPPEVWSYTLSICTFVGGIFADAAKDVVKKRLSKYLEDFLNKKKPLDRDQQEELLKFVETQGSKLRIPSSHRKKLEGDLRRLFAES
jgi:hypothetical protein